MIHTTRMTTRRRLIAIGPALGITFIAACSKTPEPAPAPSPIPAAPPPVNQPAATAPPTAAPKDTAADSQATAAAPATAMLDEKEPQAQALGYMADAARVDASKNRIYAAGSQCSGCAQYQGKSGDVTGPCTIFQGKQVAAKGWCSAFAKRA